MHLWWELHIIRIWGTSADSGSRHARTLTFQTWQKEVRIRLNNIVTSQAGEIPGDNVDFFLAEFSTLKRFQIGPQMQEAISPREKPGCIIVIDSSFIQWWEFWEQDQASQSTVMVKVELRCSADGDCDQKWTQQFYGISQCRCHGRKTMTYEPPTPFQPPQIIIRGNSSHQKLLILMVLRPLM